MTVRRPAGLALAALLASCHPGCDEPDGDKPPPLPSAAPPSSSDTETATHWVPLSEHVRAARQSKGVEPRVPSEDEREEFKSWIAEVAEAAWNDRLPRRQSPKGFVGRLAEAGRVWILAEDPQAKRGAGFVAIRPSVGEKVMIEAPHTFFEQGTLELALMAFEVLEARALLVNTIHRGGAGSGEERKRLALSGKSPFDAAHNPDSFFAIAHEVIVGLDSDMLTVQLHGFGDDNAPDADVVVSASKSKAKAGAVADALRAVMGRERVRLYPDDIDILGGTTNVEARASRKASAPFVHLEMSKSFRERAEKDPALARRFVEALGEGITKSRP